jgi:enoyl-CoA hydratase/carnithine racemase
LRLPRLVGVANAIELMFTSKMVDAGEALRIRLVSRVFSPRALATTVSPRPHKRQIYAGLLQNLGEATTSPWKKCVGVLEPKVSGKASPTF